MKKRLYILLTLLAFAVSNTGFYCYGGVNGAMKAVDDFKFK
jgi:hypothetical protein